MRRKTYRQNAGRNCSRIRIGKRKSVVFSTENGTERNIVFYKGVPNEKLQGTGFLRIIDADHSTFLSIKTGIGNDAVIGKKRSHRTGAENGMLLAKLCEGTVHGYEILIFSPPRIGAPAVRISPAGLARFISVVYGGTARPRHLDRDCLTEYRFGNPLLSRFAAQRSEAADNPVGPCQV